MGQAIANILTGVPAVYIKAYDAGNDAISGNAVDWTGWTRIGFQGEGGSTVQFNTTGELKKVMVGEFPAPVAAFVQQEGAEVGLKLAEGTPDELQYGIGSAAFAAGATPGTNPDVLKFGGGALTEWSIGWELERISDDTNKKVIVQVWKVVASPGLSLPMGRGTSVEYEYTLEALWDETRAAGQKIWRIDRLTNAAS